MDGHSIHIDFPPDEGVGDLPAPDRVRAGCAVLLDEMRRERDENVFYELSVSVLSDEEIREVNRDHRGKDRPTDVLSFPMLSDSEGEDEFITPGDFSVPGEAVHVGDILISHETCAEQAREIGHSIHDEFQRLLVHGLLHLFGYDHETSIEDEIVMRKREDELLELLAKAGL